MVKVKTSISMEQDVWKTFTRFVVQEIGSTRKLSEFVEYALKAYMTNPNLDFGFGGESMMEFSSLSNPGLFRTLKERRKEGYDLMIWRMWKK